MGLLRNLLRRPAVPFDPLLMVRMRRTRTRNLQFVSFLAAAGFERLPPHRFERAMRLRRRMAAVVVWLVVLGFGWAVLESARALSLF